MRLSNCSIRNFGPIQSYELTFDPHVTIVEGVNASGKTQLIGALYAALTGNLQKIRLHRGGNPGEVTVLAEGHSGPVVFSLVATEGDGQAIRVIRSVTTDVQGGNEGPSSAQLHVALLTGEGRRLRGPVPATTLDQLTSLEISQETIAVLRRANDQVHLLAHSETFALALARSLVETIDNVDDPTPLIVLDSPLGGMSEDKRHWVVELIHAFSNQAQMLVTLTPPEAQSYWEVSESWAPLSGANSLPEPTRSARSLLSVR